MNFLIVTHVVHRKNHNGQLGAYSPYTREMNIWGKYVNCLTIVAPFEKSDFNNYDLAYSHPNIRFVPAPLIAFNKLSNILKSLIHLPALLIILYQQIKLANHIHLRCPGNIGMFGCLVQIFFPEKKKTAKYAGNWDPNYKNPVSYIIQKWILSNTFLTRNMQVIVYGSWQGETKNIKSFFTATYFASEIEIGFKKNFETEPVFVFSGVLDERKDPIFTYQLFKAILELLPKARLHFCGDGKLKDTLKVMVNSDGFNDSVIFEGALKKENILEVYKKAHFLLFFTKTSEGWPKAVAESLFWGVLPITRPISVVAQMLANGERGFLFDHKNKDHIAKQVADTWHNKGLMNEMSRNAMKWSQEYTLDKFEIEVAKLII